MDITERKAIEQELRDAKEAAEGANRAKRAFLAKRGPEIRTPLHGILGMAELVLASELAPEQREYMSLLQSSGTSLLSIVNDILDFSKIEAGHLRIEAIEFSPAEGLADTLKTSSLRARPKGLRLV